MKHILPFFKEEELRDQALSVQTGLEMKFQDKHLVRSLAFAKHRRRLAINICQKDIAAGVFCVLTESDTHFTIWREQPSEESQKVGYAVTPKLSPQLKKTQPSRSKEKRVSSQIEEFESVRLNSTPITAINYLAADTVSQTLETTVEPIDSSSSAALQYQSALADSTTKTSETVSMSRSDFLILFKQELIQHIGPMADYLINEVLAKRPNTDTIPPLHLIEAVIAEIPDFKEARNIQKSLERLTHQFTDTM